MLFSLLHSCFLYFLDAEEYQGETMLYHSIIHIVKWSKTCSSFIIKLSQTKHVAHDYVIVSRTPSTNNPGLCSRQVLPNTHFVWWSVPTPAHPTPLPQVFSHNPKVVSLIHIPSNHDYGIAEFGRTSKVLLSSSLLEGGAAVYLDPKSLQG